jgi:hypothetical protein
MYSTGFIANRTGSVISIGVNSGLSQRDIGRCYGQTRAFQTGVAGSPQSEAIGGKTFTDSLATSRRRA